MTNEAPAQIRVLGLDLQRIETPSPVATYVAEDGPLSVWVDAYAGEEPPIAIGRATVNGRVIVEAITDTLEELPARMSDRFGHAMAAALEGRGRISVLVVEDEDPKARAIVRTVEAVGRAVGFRVDVTRAAHLGDLRVAWVTLGRFAAVVSDWELPSGPGGGVLSDGGSAVVARCLTATPAVPVVVLSGADRPESLARGAEQAHLARWFGCEWVDGVAWLMRRVQRSKGSKG